MATKTRQSSYVNTLPIKVTSSTDSEKSTNQYTLLPTKSSYKSIYEDLTIQKTEVTNPSTHSSFSILISSAIHHSTTLSVTKG